MSTPIQGVDTTLAALEQHIEGIRSRLEIALEKIMQDLAAQAVADHPYTDQSGFNTESIKGFIGEVTPHMIVGYLSAGMPYSQFLELAKAGKYAFLQPVIERNKDKITTILQRVAQ